MAQEKKKLGVREQDSMKAKVDMILCRFLMRYHMLVVDGSCQVNVLPQGFPSTSSRRLAVEFAVPNLNKSLVKNNKIWGYATCGGERVFTISTW